ncbi:hypothetical protein BDV95DRAFT_221320 [Massariosphaeria phaeospora]|uniref:Lysine-specific metallo-endopeptidase domain-containing protein n=1 Tax=Massariosphaeria phaeospora TaxID=100035 RepID=A0A7C8MGF5_9PLEO|nr:hypothetical protein BDV95DRAFT_221320 [Massariosphaeria phaeospora]
MKSSLVFSFLVLAVPSFATIIFDPVQNTCGSNGAAAGAALMAEVTSLGSHAAKLMDEAHPGNLRVSDPWKFYRVMTAYNAFFDAHHSDGVNRWDDVKSKLDIMGNLGSNSPNVFVACDDTPFWDATNPSALIFHDPDQKKDVTFGPGQLTCAGGNTADKNMIGYRISINNVNYIMLCLKQNGGKSLLSEHTFNEGDSLNDKTTLSSVLFHEMSHAAIPSMRGDLSGGTAEGGERYAWLGTQEVRATYANENPDSFTLYAIALATDAFHWDTGIAETQNTVYNRLEKSAPEVITTSGLTVQP